MRFEPIRNSSPKYRQLSQQLAARIRSGEFSPGSFLPSEAELTKATGVSRVTVRSAIKLLARQGLIVRQQGRRSQVAAHVAVEKTGILLGLTYRSRMGLDHPYAGGIIRGINFALGEANIDLELINVSPRALALTQASPGELLESCDGLFLLFPWLDADEIESVVDDGKVVVSIGVHPDGVDIPQVYMDERAGHRAMINHLINLGHRKIGIVGPSRVGYPISQGCHRTLYLLEEIQHAADAGRVEVRPQWIKEVPEFTRECGFVGATEILGSSEDLPTAIIATEDSLAFGVMDAAAEAGLRTPEDLSVTGMGNYLDHETTRITSLSVPTFEMGVLAGEAMLDELQGRSHRDLPRFPLELILGDTTTKPRAARRSAGPVVPGNQEKRHAPLSSTRSPVSECP